MTSSISCDSQWVGIDVSQAKLDIAIRPSNLILQVANTPSGWQQLQKQLQTCNPIERIVLESTGGLETGVAHFLREAGYPVSVINPSRARHFAQSSGRFAKTDRIDAQGLAHFAQAIEPPVQVLPSAAEQALRELVSRRRQLVEIPSNEKRRLRTARHRSARADIEAHLDWLEERIQALDDQIEQARQEHHSAQATYELLVTVPGDGRVIATELVAGLPDLGQLPSKQLASLVGVAPLNRDSGTKRGRRRIVGGRARIRSALYLAAMVATRYNPTLRRFYQRLRQEGRKPPKVALIACARKLLTILNAMVTHQTAWLQPAAALIGSPLLMPAIDF